MVEVDTVVLRPSSAASSSNMDTSSANFDDDHFDDDQFLGLDGHPPSHSCFQDEARASFILMKGTKLNLLLIFAPMALIGSKSGLIGEFLCFCCAGLALIPCAERLSFVTEHVAEHTNETIGALLNATFGNAPELLISSAALRNGFYRVVQLTLLGSVLTNLLFVFGLSCFVGGMRWQVQEIRITSGNVSIGMLLIATMGIVLPAVLKLANETVSNSKTVDDEVTDSDIFFSRLNSLAMVFGYCCYLIFQLGSHKDEFDYNGDEYAKFGGGHNIVRTSHFQHKKKKKHPVRRNEFCQRHCLLMKYCPDIGESSDPGQYAICRDTEENLHECEMVTAPHKPRALEEQKNSFAKRRKAPQNIEISNCTNTLKQVNECDYLSDDANDVNDVFMTAKSKMSDAEEVSFTASKDTRETMSMRMGLFWLFAVTTAISLISNIIVDTIDGFASRSKMSEVFISVIIVPYFSNIAEQVSAVIFAYKNKMDLCVGVTIGSAIQVVQFIMPSVCLCAWVMGRSMTLYFRAYETVCLFLGVVCVASVIQGGTTNWLVGVFMIIVYLMIAAGFCFHEKESLSNDEEQIVTTLA